METRLKLVVSLTPLLLPQVIAMGKAHFGCSTLNGVELENGGGPSTAGSHWEARILHEEIMVRTAEFQGYRNGV